MLYLNLRFSWSSPTSNAFRTASSHPGSRNPDSKSPRLTRPLRRPSIPAPPYHLHLRTDPLTLSLASCNMSLSINDTPMQFVCSRTMRRRGPCNWQPRRLIGLCRKWPILFIMNDHVPARDAPPDHRSSTDRSQYTARNPICRRSCSFRTKKISAVSLSQGVRPPQTSSLDDMQAPFQDRCVHASQHLRPPPFLFRKTPGESFDNSLSRWRV